MPTKEITALRKEGKLEEALAMAKAELEADPNTIWPKRNISWVFYEYLKQYNTPDHFDQFMSWIDEIRNLQMPDEEKVLFDQVGWQTGKMVFALMRTEPVDTQKCIRLLESIEPFHFTRPSEGYSFLFSAFHKALKETNRYTIFADWWDLQNFRPEDFQKEKLPNGKEVMAIAEQGYIAYAKHLLPSQTPNGAQIFDRVKAEAFLPRLAHIADTYPQFQYPAYFQAKLLLALGDQENLLDSLLPFVRRKKNDFWAWEILGEAFHEGEKRFACYCKALSCHSPSEMLVGLRQKMAGKLISKGLYSEAKTEIEQLLSSRKDHGWRIPNEVMQWQSKDWYKDASALNSNSDFYKKYLPEAEALLFADTPEETILVEFVNTDRSILNFIASESKIGFFKYDRFFRKVNIGDTIKVRFQDGTVGGIYKVYTAVKTDDDSIRKQFMNEVEGVVKIAPGRSFGFIGDVFVHPSIVSRLKLSDGQVYKGMAMKTYNQDKKEWSWKLI